MRILFAGLIAVAAMSAARDAVAQDEPVTSHDAAVATYEQLATVIISVRQTEDSLVNSILRHHRAEAVEHLLAAQANDKERAKHLEAAAAEITNIANEGDKRVQAIRQRLSKAGHTHNTDAETNEDYMFIDSKEKKELLALAKKVAQLGAKAKPDQIAAAAKELNATFDKAMAAEK